MVFQNFEFTSYKKIIIAGRPKEKVYFEGKSCLYVKSAEKTILDDVKKAIEIGVLKYKE